MKRIVLLSAFIICALMVQAQSYKFKVEAMSMKIDGHEERSYPQNLYMYLNSQCTNLRLSNGTAFSLKKYKPTHIGHGMVGWSASTKDDNGVPTNIVSIELDYANSGKWSVIFSNKRYEVIYILNETR